MAVLIISKHVSLLCTLCRFFSVSLSRAARSHPAGLALHHVGLTAVNLSDGRGWPLAQGLGAMGAKAPESWRFSLSLFIWKKCRSFRKLKGLLCQKNMLSRFSWSDHNPTASRLKASLLKFSCLPTNIAPFQGCFCHFPQESHGHMMLHSSTLIRWILHSSNQVTCHSSAHGDQPRWSLQICKSLPFVNQTTGKSPVNMGVVVAKSSIDSIFPG